MDVGVHEMTMEDEEDDFMLSRNYFLAKEIGNSSRKKSSQKHVVDINHVDEQVLRKEVFDIPVKHENEIQHLIKSYRNLYPKWHFELRCGFGLLMYGFGSKKALLEDFASTSLNDFGVVVINGYLPSNNLKQALITLAEVLSDQLKHERKSATRSKSNTEHTFSSLSIEDLLSFLNVQLPQDNNLWDKKMVHTQFKWSWHHVPTFAPYKAEGNFFPLILANYGNAQTTKTALVVLQSMPNSTLYTKCRARFLVSNQVTLNSHLTEFKDHELVKARRHSDGQDCFYIPLPSEALSKLLQELA
ncbi:hypothetical protein ZIOFF_075428 [Zingiber officinale]|uniref:Origin recognition complex subunit 2 n=1 Tax=Zingiber officinale TaxID=94328 RepID=A0A8J5C4H7_ZINOF|nr:hypothetical protein ZIOFF_075428 [Zingiber officinale]